MSWNVPEDVYEVMMDGRVIVERFKPYEILRPLEVALKGSILRLEQPSGEEDDPERDLFVRVVDVFHASPKQTAWLTEGMPDWEREPIYRELEAKTPKGSGTYLGRLVVERVEGLGGP